MIYIHWQSQFQANLPTEANGLQKKPLTKQKQNTNNWEQGHCHPVYLAIIGNWRFYGSSKALLVHHENYANSSMVPTPDIVKQYPWLAKSKGMFQY